MRRFLIPVAAVLTVAALPAAAQAGTLTVKAGILSYTDTSTTDANSVSFAISPDGARVTVTENGKGSRNRAIAITSDGSCTASGTIGSCAFAGLTSITVDTGALNDTILQTTPLASRLVGGSGNDTITGGPGSDTFPTDAGADVLAGGDGIDVVDYSSQHSPVTVSLDGVAGDGTPGENDNVGADIEQVIGGSANDSLTGNAGNNSLIGNEGDDTLTGNEGDDSLEGGAGNDAMIGGDGVDTASYSSAAAGVRVVLDGQPGDGSTGESDNADTENVVGSAFDDVLIGNAGVNVLSGGNGNDRILGGNSADVLDGGTGDDILQSLDGTKDTVACGDGEDGVVSDRRDARTDCDYIKYRPLAASSTALHVSKGVVRAPVRCSPATAAGCHGRVALKAGARTLGSLAYRLTSGRRWVARIKLSRRGRAYVAKRRVTTASLVVRDVDATGDANRTTQTIRIGR